MDKITLNKDSYSKDEVQGFIDTLNQQITDLTDKVTEGDKAIAKVKELEKTNVSNSIKLALTKAGLDVETYFNLVESEDVEKAQKKIDKLVEINKKAKVDNGYKPDGKKTGDEYAKMEKDGNVEGMLKSKLSKLF